MLAILFCSLKPKALKCHKYFIGINLTISIFIKHSEQLQNFILKLLQYLRIQILSSIFNLFFCSFQIQTELIDCKWSITISIQLIKYLTQINLIDSRNSEIKYLSDKLSFINFAISINIQLFMKFFVRHILSI